MTERSVSHTSFVIERDLPASPERVFRAWSDPDAKRRWSDCHPEMGGGYSLDFRPGGSEVSRTVLPDGAVYVVRSHFFDIVPERRIVYAYEMRLSDTCLSASLVTVEFTPGDGGTRMVFSEQLAFFDGHEDRAERIRGTSDGIDRLEAALRAEHRDR